MKLDIDEKCMKPLMINDGLTKEQAFAASVVSEFDISRTNENINSLIMEKHNISDIYQNVPTN